MKNIILTGTLLTLSLLFLAGCTNVSAESLLKSLPQVKEFMEQYPDAQFSLTSWSLNYTTNHLEELKAECGDNMEAKEYYYSTVKQGKINLKMWLDKSNMELACLISTGYSANEVTGDISCDSYCKGQLAECAGAVWAISGEYPNCDCKYSCTGAPDVVQDVSGEALGPFYGIECFDSDGKDNFDTVGYVEEVWDNGEKVTHYDECNYRMGKGIIGVIDFYCENSTTTHLCDNGEYCNEPFMEVKSTTKLCNCVNGLCVEDYCWNGYCDNFETYETCPSDCSPNCRDGVCGEDEDYKNCPDDCAIISELGRFIECGDGICDQGEDDPLSADYCYEDCSTEITVLECYDTDNGIDYTVKGYTKGVVDPTTNVIESLSDFCMTGENSDWVYEHYCGTEGATEGYVVGTSNRCPYGCRDGVCLTNETSGSVFRTIVSCVDSDNGENFDKVGTITVTYNDGFVQSFTDSCGWTSGGAAYGAKDYYCGTTNDGEIHYWASTKECECSNGLCVTSTGKNEICANGIDDDGDKRIDCSDQECFCNAGYSACEYSSTYGAYLCVNKESGYEHCNNGLDDDSDGFIDCFDPICACISRYSCVNSGSYYRCEKCMDDACCQNNRCVYCMNSGRYQYYDSVSGSCKQCRSSSECETGYFCDNNNMCTMDHEVCENQDDDDRDGLLNCKDSDCNDNPFCPEVCYNYVDDNNNGLADCEDPICMATMETCRTHATTSSKLSGVNAWCNSTIDYCLLSLTNNDVTNVPEDGTWTTVLMNNQGVKLTYVIYSGDVAGAAPGRGYGFGYYFDQLETGAWTAGDNVDLIANTTYKFFLYNLELDAYATFDVVAE